MNNLDEPVLGEVGGDAAHGLRHVALARLDVDLGRFWRLVRRRDAREVCSISDVSTVGGRQE